MKKKKLLIGVLVVFVLAVLCVGIGYSAFAHYFSSSNFVSDEQVAINHDYLNAMLETEEESEEETDLEQLTLDSSALAEGYVGETEQETELDLASIQQASAEQIEGTYTLLLIGVDRRTDDWYGNSDVMILATINYDQQKLFLTSFMRDLYADIPGYGVMKLNAAHAIGGGPLLVETIETNYGVTIDNYARVDFSTMSDVVDVIGGVDIDVDENEANYINSAAYNMAIQQGKEYDGSYVTGGGIAHLNGLQAVAYSRIRHIGNSDYERTSRQREVLTEMFSKVSTLSLAELNNVINEMLPLVTHNISQLTMVKLMAQVPELIEYEVVTDRVPYDDLFTSRNGLLVPDMAATAARLQETIYAKE